MTFARTLFLLCFTLSASAQGFGKFSSKTVTINRLLPPTVNLKGKAVRIDASVASQFPLGDRLDSLLKTKLVTLVQKDPRFIMSEVNPQTILKFTITNFYLEQFTTGSGSSERHPYRGKMEVSYQALDAASNIALDSENLVQTSGYDLENGTSWSEVFHRNGKKEAAEASSNEARDQLIAGIVQQMAVRIAPLDQPFPARVPGGKLDGISALALAQRWGDVEEKADAMEKFPKPEDDAYRLYLVALAKEAQAYDLTREANAQDLGKRTDLTPEQAAKDIANAQKRIDEAGAIYKKLVVSNPKEKDFREGDNRTEQAMQIYATIQRYKDEYAKAQAAQVAKIAAGASTGSSSGGPPKTPSSEIKTPLDRVLDFCAHGMDVESVKDYIQSSDFLTDAKSSSYKFNFGQDPLRLQETCKTNAPIYQKLMRARLSGTPPVKPTPAKTPAKR